MRKLLIPLIALSALCADPTVQNPSVEVLYSSIKQIEKVKEAQGSLNKKGFVREATYSSGDSDSKISAREKACDMVRKELLAEVGVYLQSEFTQDKSVVVSPSGDSYKDTVREQITELTAGVTEMKVLEERWDGKEFYVKAEIFLDPDAIREGIILALKGKIAQEEVARLNSLVASKDSKLNETIAKFRSMQDQITSQQLYEVGLKQSIESLTSQLNSLRGKIQEEQTKKTSMQNELDYIVANINKANIKASNVIKMGMSRQDIVNLLGPFDPYRQVGAMYFGSCNDNITWPENGRGDIIIYPDKTGPGTCIILVNDKAVATYPDGEYSQIKVVFSPRGYSSWKLLPR